MRCKCRCACCKEALRTVRHDSAAGQRRKPVATPVVDWFYVTASFQMAPSVGEMMLDREAYSTSLSTFNMHLFARTVKREQYLAGRAYDRLDSRGLSSRRAMVGQT